MINFVKSGDNLTLAAPYDVQSGGGFKVGNVFGVAANDTLSALTSSARSRVSTTWPKTPAPLRRVIWRTGTIRRRR